MRKILFLTAMFAFLLTSSAWAADISGTWTLSMWGAGAQESFPVTFAVAGEKVTVTADHPAFQEMSGTGTLKGEEIAFNLKSSAMEVAFTGKVAGSEMRGLREIVGSGGGGPGGGAPQGGMPEGTGGPQGGQGAPETAQGAPPQGGQGAPQGMVEQGGGSEESSEEWVAVKN